MFTPTSSRRKLTTAEPLSTSTEAAITAAAAVPQIASPMTPLTRPFPAPPPAPNRKPRPPPAASIQSQEGATAAAAAAASCSPSPLLGRRSNPQLPRTPFSTPFTKRKNSNLNSIIHQYQVQRTKMKHDKNLGVTLGTLYFRFTLLAILLVWWRTVVKATIQ